MMKKLALITLALICTVFALILAANIFSIGDLNKISIEAIHTSPEISKESGKIKFLLLTAASDKLRPNGGTCGTRHFFLIGDKAALFVDVISIKKDFHHGSWEVVEITQGMFAQTKQYCR